MILREKRSNYLAVFQYWYADNKLTLFAVVVSVNFVDYSIAVNGVVEKPLVRIVGGSAVVVICRSAGKRDRHIVKGRFFHDSRHPYFERL